MTVTEILQSQKDWLCMACGKKTAKILRITPLRDRNALSVVWECHGATTGRVLNDTYIDRAEALYRVQRMIENEVADLFGYVVPANQAVTTTTASFSSIMINRSMYSWDDPYDREVLFVQRCQDELRCCLCKRPLWRVIIQGSLLRMECHGRVETTRLDEVFLRRDYLGYLRSLRPFAEDLLRLEGQISAKPIVRKEVAIAPPPRAIEVE